MMKTFIKPDKTDWREIIKRPRIPSDNLDNIVREVLNDVKNNGDQALRKYSKKFDSVDLENIQVPDDEIIQSEKNIDKKLKEAIDLAVSNITLFHESQKNDIKYIETMPGVICWQKSVAIEKVGLYIPGGTAPLFSTVLMLAVPAKIAGCGEIILCTPPAKNGSVNPAILYAAKVTGITKVFKVGGAQAIAAMAYGTETVPGVYKIFGPGNQYVTAAKQLVNREGIAIDMPAGPSEVLVVADKTSDPAFVASDLLAQAEHGADSHVVLVTIDDKIIEPVIKEIKKQLENLSRSGYALQSVSKSVAIAVNDTDELVELINMYAPEHLIISVDNYIEISEKVVNAGSVFLGHYTPESAGDYASGTNHTLPTYGFARAYNGVNLDSYVKKITYQEISREGLQKIGKAIEIMAENEELTAHKNSVTLRLKK